MSHVSSVSAQFDLVVIGGGMSGIAAAVACADAGWAVALVHERPVLGGNASSEIRVNLEGANGGGHNRFFVESGLAEDLLLENFWRNPTGSADIWSALLYDTVVGHGVTLFLDTCVVGATKTDDRTIAEVTAVTLGSECVTSLKAPFFVDSTGDGTVAFMAGARFMYGEDPRSAFGEDLAPTEATRFTNGATMMFMCKDVGRRVDYVRPAFARVVDHDELLENRDMNVWAQAPVLGGFWWIEYGGELDSITDNQQIKRVLLSEVFGLWDLLKNDAKYREQNRNLDLEWVAALPGKRESRRVLGPYVLSEPDLVERRTFDDAIAYGGWSLDRHPPKGFMAFDERPAAQIHLPGLYQIPLRACLSVDVDNLLLAGRNISASHVAHCSARVMLTCTHIGEAIGTVVAECLATGRDPASLASETNGRIGLRSALERRGHFVPYRELIADRPGADTMVAASSYAPLADCLVDRTVSLDLPRMLSLPPGTQRIDAVSFWISNDRPTEIGWAVHDSGHDLSWDVGNEISSGTLVLEPSPGRWHSIPVGLGSRSRYTHVVLVPGTDGISLGANDSRRLGPLSWIATTNDLKTGLSDQRADLGWRVPQVIEFNGDSGAYLFSRWKRETSGWGRPPAPSISFLVVPEQPLVELAAVLEPRDRPTPNGVHAWVSDREPGTLVGPKFVFDTPVTFDLRLAPGETVSAVTFTFNSDLEHHLANVWFSHPVGVRAKKTLPADVEVLCRDGDGWTSAFACADHHSRRLQVDVPQGCTDLRLVLSSTWGADHVSIMDVQVRADRMAQ